MFAAFTLVFVACENTNSRNEPAPTQQSGDAHPPNPAGEQVKDPEPPPPPPISTDPITLKFAINATWLSEGEFEHYFVEPVKKRYPFITLELINLSNPETSLGQLIVTGELPDIVQSANPIIYTFTDTGMADDIEPLIKKHNFDMSKLNPVALETVKVSTGYPYLSGLPWTMHFNATYYNKDIFEKFGVNFPRDGMTWEEVRDLAVSLSRTEDGINYRGLEPDGPSYMSSIFSQGFVDPATNKATLNNDTWKRVFAFMKSIYDIPGNEKYTWAPGSTTQFMKDRTLAMLTSINLLPNFRDYPELNWDMIQYPQFADFPNTGTQMDGWILHITKQSKYKDQAFQVLATALSEEVQLEIARNARFPILTNAEIQKEFGKNMPHLEGKNLQAAFKSQPAKAILANKFSSPGVLAIQAAFHKVAAGTEDINTALSKAEEELNAKIAEAQ